MRLPTLVFAIMAAALSLTVANAAMPQQSEQASISHAWIRWLPGKLPMAGYFTITNSGSSKVVLTGAASRDFGKVMMHESVNKGGAETMRHVARLPVPAGEHRSFAPGGYHLMLMQRRHAIKVGDTLGITLQFADGSSKKIEFIVKGAAG